MTSHPVTLRQLWATAAILLCGLVGVGFIAEHRRPTQDVFDGRIRFDRSPDRESERSVTTVSEPFLLTGPTTLQITQRGTSGMVHSHAALIDTETGVVREVDLVTFAPGSDDEQRVTLDAIPSGRYSLRFDTRGRIRPEQTSEVRLRAVQGASTPWAFVLAALALLAPPLGMTAYRLRRAGWRRSPPTGAVDSAVAAR